jgi:hypothetical protein
MQKIELFDVGMAHLAYIFIGISVSLFTLAG